jgi:3-phosphoshikimate 1-carboxyvinyltransferase
LDLFFFSGNIPPSKSLMNRALIIQQFNGSFQWEEFSEALDVLNLKNALADFASGKTKLYCGDGGTTFRFLSVFLSKYPGRYEISIDEALKKRPHLGLEEFFNQVRVNFSWSEDHLVIESDGWKANSVHLISEQTSQIASAIILCLWKLPNAFELSVSEDIFLYGYFQMTLDFCKSCGLNYDEAQDAEGFKKIKVAKEQAPKSQMTKIEPDISSCFPLAVLGALKQPVHIKNFPTSSLQPDFQFIDFFKSIKVAFDLSSEGLKVFPSRNLKAFSADLNHCPDLFPVMCVFASFCQGVTTLSGLKRLAYKESNRLTETIRLLQLHDVSVELGHDQVVIYGKEIKVKSEELKNTTNSDVIFDSASDHRMAMAAMIFQIMGSKIQISNKLVLNKSFPEFAVLVRPLLPMVLKPAIDGSLKE